VRFLVKVHLADERLDDALEVAEHRLSLFKKRDWEPVVSQAQATTNLALADVYVAMKRFCPALKIATAALDAFRELEDEAGVVTALQTIARVNLKLGGESSLNALQSAEEALAVSARVGDMEEESAILLTLSKVHRRRQEYSQAEDYAIRSVEVAQTKGCKTGEASGLKEIAKVYVASGWKLDVALNVSTKAENIFEEVFDPLGEVATLRVIANVHDLIGNSEEASRAIRNALVLAQTFKHRGQIAITLVMMCRLAPSGAVVEVLNEEAQFAKDLGDGVRQVAALRMLINFQLENGLCAEASTATEEVEALVAATPDKKAKGSGLLLLAQLHNNAASNRINNAASNRNAMEYATKALALFQGAGALSETMTTLHFMSKICAETQHDEVLLKVLDEQQGMYKAAGWKEEEAEVLLKGSEVIYRVHGPELASVTAEAAAGLFGELRDEAGEAHALLALAGLHGETHRVADALEATCSARKLFQSLKDVNGETQALLAAANVYLANNKSTEALAIATVAQELAQGQDDNIYEAISCQAIAAVHIHDLNTGREPRESALEGALHATSQSLKLFQAAEDINGEIDSLLRLASLYTAAQECESALRAAEEGLELCIKLGDSHGTGSALLTVAETHLAFNNGNEAAQVAQDAAALFQELGNREGLEIAFELVASAERLLIGGGTSRKCSEGVVPVALEEGMYVCFQGLISRPELNGQVGLLIQFHTKRGLWQVQLQGHEDILAKEDKLVPKEVYEAVLENARVASLPKCQQEEPSTMHRKDGAWTMKEPLKESDSDRPMTRLPKKTKTQNGNMTTEPCDGSPVRPAATNSWGHRPFESKAFSQMSKPRQQPSQQQQQHQTSLRGAFSQSAQMAEEELERQRPPVRQFPDESIQELRLQQLLAFQAEPVMRTPTESLRDVQRPPVRQFLDEPNQELRRQQLSTAQAEPVMRTPARSLGEVLRAVRPDWNSSDLRLVKEKLAELDIETPLDLFRLLRAEGPGILNKKLKAVGKKPLKVETLVALRAYGDSCYPTPAA